MVAAAAKKTSKSPARAVRKPDYPTHPPWTDMIAECITTTPDGSRHGVSRPAIKKFVDSKYHLSMNAATISQLNRAIAHGAFNGNFVLPKGPSGKVKLAAKRGGEIAQERPAVTKDRGTAKKANMPPVAEKQPPKAFPTTKRYTSRARKAHVTPTPGRRIPARTATVKRGDAKRAIAGSHATVRKLRTATIRAGSSSRKRTAK